MRACCCSPSSSPPLLTTILTMSADFKTSSWISGAFFTNKFLCLSVPVSLPPLLAPYCLSPLCLSCTRCLPLSLFKFKSAIRRSINIHLFKKLRKSHFHNISAQTKQTATWAGSYCTNWPGWWACSSFIFSSPSHPPFLPHLPSSLLTLNNAPLPFFLSYY